MNRDLDKWNKKAALWLSRVSDHETPRKILIEDGMRRLVPEPKGKSILDAGCGDGWLSDLWTHNGASVVAIDGSPVFVEEAKKRYPGVDFRVSDLMLPQNLPDQAFDIIAANMLFNSLSDLTVFLDESHRMLKDRGELIISVLHPCLSFPTLELYKSFWDKIFQRQPNGLVVNYFTRTTERPEDQIGSNLPFYHRTLSEYSEQLHVAGFAIEEMYEPNTFPPDFLKKNGQYEYFTRIARFLFIKAVKS
jgi:ubiquinone/menaquinone biosynthesis C-methylase UbiE